MAEGGAYMTEAIVAEADMAKAFVHKCCFCCLLASTPQNLFSRSITVHSSIHAQQLQTGQPWLQTNTQCRVWLLSHIELVRGPALC